MGEGDEWSRRGPEGSQTVLIGARNCSEESEGATRATFSMIFSFSAVVFARSEEHTSELQSRQYLHSFPTRRSSDLVSNGLDRRQELLGGERRRDARDFLHDFFLFGGRFRLGVAVAELDRKSTRL